MLLSSTQVRKLLLTSRARTMQSFKIPSLPKNIVSDFGLSLKASLERQINELVDMNIIEESNKDILIPKVFDYLT